jgi:sterol desaturase/sphingolipid hydroxylase (fatty acid hydroxylase superfamily)
MLPSLLPDWCALAVGIWIVEQISYHAFGLLFELFDRIPLMRTNFKVRDTDKKGYRDFLLRNLVNQVFILLPCMVLTQAYGLCFVGNPRLPLDRFLLSLPVMALGHDVVQYVAHRQILHRTNVRFFRWLGHGVHHTTTASCGISACYMSMADFFLEIACPYLIPLALVGGGGADVLFHCLVVSSGAFGGLYEHSGYDFSVKVPGKGVVMNWVREMITTKAHHAHHSLGNVSFSDGFGSPGICDRIYETRWDIMAEKKQRERESRATPLKA